jgi:hypothetical protein
METAPNRANEPNGVHQGGNRANEPNEVQQSGIRANEPNRSIERPAWRPETRRDRKNHRNTESPWRRSPDAPAAQKGRVLPDEPIRRIRPKERAVGMEQE